MLADPWRTIRQAPEKKERPVVTTTIVANSAWAIEIARSPGSEWMRISRCMKRSITTTGMPAKMPIHMSRRTRCASRIPRSLTLWSAPAALDLSTRSPL